MAHSKSFFGLRRGSTKSLTFSVLNGKQITKDRVTEVRNPKTNAQMIQRAIMATVMQAYSAGKEIFDHAFQGYSVGARCQSRFMSLNARALRDALSQNLGHVVAPGTNIPVPNEYVIAEGNYPHTAFTSEMISGISEGAVTIPGGQHTGTLAAFLNNWGLVSGDVITVVAFAINNDNPVYAGTSTGDTQYDCRFGWVRMIVRSFTEEQLAADFDPNKLQDIMILTASESETARTLATQTFDSELRVSDIIDSANGEYIYGCLGVIRSRLDQDLRSSSKMVYADQSTYGILFEHITNVWTQGTVRLGNSRLILEGRQTTVTPTSSTVAGSVIVYKTPIEVKNFTNGGSVNLTDTTKFSVSVSGNDMYNGQVILRTPNNTDIPFMVSGNGTIASVDVATPVTGSYKIIANAVTVGTIVVPA